MKTDSIDIFKFKDPRDYLRAVLLQRKERDKTFRFSAFSRQAGFASPSLLSMLLNGQRNLAPGSAEKLAKSLSLNGRRKAYFLAMAQSRKAKSTEEETEARESMLRIKSKAQKTLLELKQYEFLTTWYYSVIYILAGMKSTQWNSEWIAKRLGRGITEEQVKTAVADLISLGLLKHEEGRCVRMALSITTQDDIQDVAARRYHVEMNKLADESISLALDEREFSGVTVAVPRNQLPFVKEKLRTFRKELNEILSQFEEDADDVYQLNLQLFPLTQSLSDKESL